VIVPLRVPAKRGLRRRRLTAGGRLVHSGPFDGLEGLRKARTGSWPWPRRRAGREGQGELSPARLADLTPALLGLPISIDPLRNSLWVWWRWPADHLPVELRRIWLQRQGRLTLSQTGSLGVKRACPCCGQPPRRETDNDGHLHLLVVGKLPAATCESPTTPSCRSNAHAAAAGCLWTKYVGR